MKNRDLIKLALLNAEQDKEAVRQGAIKRVARKNTMKRVVASAACTVLIAGGCFGFALHHAYKENEYANTIADHKSNTTTLNSNEYEDVISNKTNSTLIYENFNPTTPSEPKKANKKTHRTYSSVTRTTSGDLNEEFSMFKAEDFWCSEEGDGIVIHRYMGNDKKVVIPSEIKGKKVKSINGMLGVNEKIERIWIPECVTYIAEGVFSSNNDLVICGVEGSYAQQYAEENDFEFSEHSISY